MPLSLDPQTEFDLWISDDARQEGDVEILAIQDPENPDVIMGYRLVYFIDASDMGFADFRVRQDLLEDAYRGEEGFLATEWENNPLPSLRWPARWLSHERNL